MPAVGSTPLDLTMFRAFERAYARAAACAGGPVRHVLELGGTRIALEFAGRQLAEPMMRPFAHLAVQGESEVVIRCWDSESTGVPLPDGMNPWDVHFQSLPAEQRDRSLRWAYQRPDPGLTAYNVAERSAVYWIPSSDLTYGDLAGSLRAPIAWASAERGRHFLHCAGVGFEGKAGLIVGASGSGKSSTALTCLLAGMDYLGDDHCLISLDERPMAHAIYAAAKLHTAQLARFPELNSLLVNPDRDPTDKGVALLYPRFQAQLPKELPIAAVLVPKIGESKGTTIEPLQPAAALLALAPSTLLQMTAAEGGGLAAMAQLVRRVPCYRITVGASRAAIADAVRQLLHESRLP